MKVDTKVVSQADAAVMLRARLGPLRSWPDFLADNIRGKQDISGYVLLPCARKKDGRGGLRPVYAITAINDFVARVKAVVPNAGKVPIQATVLKVETGWSWRSNVFDRHGAPLVKSRLVSVSIF